MKNYKVFFFLFVLSLHLYGQKNTIKGYVFDENQKPLGAVRIKTNNQSTQTNEQGYYEIELTSSDSEIFYSKIGFQDFYTKKSLTENRDFLLNVLLVKQKPIEPLDTIEITIKKKQKKPAQSIELSSEMIQKLPTLSGGIEDMLKTLPGVNSNSELSSKYAVRGGNFDENLVYIDNLEVITPNLIRNGQQEGLSLINSTMADRIYFSAGGFEAAFGDKMSSLLAVNYRNPTKNKYLIESSLLGTNATGDYLSKNKKFSVISGIRYLDRTLVLNTFSEETEFSPKFFDAQTKVKYSFNRKWEINYMGKYSNNTIAIDPKSKQVDFGTLINPVQLNLYYEGKERDQYKTFFNAFSAFYKPNSKLTFDFSLFTHHLEEQESFDIQSYYFFNKEDPSSSTLPLDFGLQIDHARNDLLTKIYGIQQNLTYAFGSNNKLRLGIKYQKEEWQDRINEWQLIVANGYSFPSNYDNFPPDLPNDEGINLRYAVNSKAKITSQRFSGFSQYAKQWNLAKGNLFFTGGIRGTYWDFNSELNISPRTQIAYRPKSKKNTEYRLASGLYFQPPFYREMRDLNGNLNENIQSQKSFHVILGNDYSIQWKKKKVNITTEIYYKKLDQLIPYYLDNIRIRYTAQNNSKGQSYGIDTRFSVELSKGLESWLSLSYARTTENINNRGVIPRPTDQRFRAALLFQDYMPEFPSIKMMLNLVYAAGLPNGAPLFTDPYLFQSNLPDYKRVDISLFKVFKDKNTLSQSKIFNPLSEFVLGIEIFNLFDIKNTISNQSVVDISSNTIYLVPYTLTGRFFNLKMVIKSK